MKIGRLTPQVQLVDQNGHATIAFANLWDEMAKVLERVVGDTPPTFDPGTITLPDLAQLVQDDQNRIAGTES